MFDQPIKNCVMKNIITDVTEIIKEQKICERFIKKYAMGFSWAADQVDKNT